MYILRVVTRFQVGSQGNQLPVLPHTRMVGTPRRASSLASPNSFTERGRGRGFWDLWIRGVLTWLVEDVVGIARFDMQMLSASELLATL